MSKSKSSPTDKEAKPATRRIKDVASKNIAKAIAALRKQKKINILAFILGIGIMLYGSSQLGAGSYAMLYLLANNGRLSGRADGNVYQRNGRVRAYATPALVQNGYTTPIRALLSALSSAWNVLTEEERDTWVAMEWLSKTDRFGQPISIRGKDAYVTLNSNLALVGAATISEAPIDSGGVPGISGLTVVPDQSATTLTLTYTPTPTDAAVTHMVFATRPMSAGTFKPRKSDFRLIDFIPSNQVSPWQIETPYTAKYGDAWDTNAGYVGGKIFVLLKPINEDTGAEGANIVAAGIIQA